MHLSKFIELSTKKERTLLYVNYTLIKLTLKNYKSSFTFVLLFIYFLNNLHFWTTLSPLLSLSLKYQSPSKFYPSTPMLGSGLLLWLFYPLCLRWSLLMHNNNTVLVSDAARRLLKGIKQSLTHLYSPRNAM